MNNGTKTSNMGEFTGRFKALTGYKISDMAAKANVSKQHVSASLKNHSLTYKTSMAYLLIIMIEEKVKELEENIDKLIELKKDIKEKALEKGD